MQRRLMLVLAVAGLLLVPPPRRHARPSAWASGTKSVAMFDQPAFQRAKFKRVRYFLAWNALDNTAAGLAAGARSCSAPAATASRCCCTSPATTRS